MKILIISKSGDGFGIAQKMQDEGHEVKAAGQVQGPQREPRHRAHRIAADEAEEQAEQQ